MLRLKLLRSSIFPFENSSAYTVLSFVGLKLNASPNYICLMLNFILLSVAPNGFDHM